MIDKEVLLDLERLSRLGMVEAIWGENKSCEQIAGILRRLEAASQLALVTRLSQEKAEKLLRTFQKAEYHSEASCLTLGPSIVIDESLGEKYSDSPICDRGCFRHTYVSKGDKIMVYGSGSEADGPASEGWKIKLKYTWTGDQIGSDFLLPP